MFEAKIINVFRDICEVVLNINFATIIYLHKREFFFHDSLLLISIIY